MRTKKCHGCLDMENKLIGVSKWEIRCKRTGERVRNMKKCPKETGGKQGRLGEHP